MASSGKSEDQSANTSSGMNQSYINKAQLDSLKQLWGQSTNQILNQDLGQANTNAQNSMIAGIQNNPFMQGVNQTRDYVNNAKQQIGVLRNDLQKQFSDVLLPQIGDAAIQGGSLGGGRQGVAQGMAAEGMQNALSAGASSIYNNAFNAANQAQQFGAQQFLNQQTAGMQALGQAQQQQYAPLLALAQILGNPAILSRGNQAGSGFSRGSDEKFSILGG